MFFKRQKVNLAALEDYLQTGDIILMHGLYASSRLIEFVEDSRWSHSAMIVRPEDIGLSSKLPVLIWESNLLTDMEDVMLKIRKDGPQLLPLADRIAYDYEQKNDSMFAIRHLYVQRTPAMLEGLKQAITMAHPTHFPDSFHEFSNFLLGRMLGIGTQDSTYFCSQLLAFTLEQMGLLAKLLPCNSYAPVDFSEKLDVSLLQRAFFGKEIELLIEGSKASTLTQEQLTDFIARLKENG